ncbi:helix-turn-helix domain-containing protein [Agromyces sp. S2-1-8]|uniref:helix-turn-helix domain-containing protein n=1 Tax=Agromyces sp. S2-1-8 TaxID=2897180 RepID=UPI001E309379|nr:helix-turn-helix domain-containing protein [Agromyces sp. S2-1-8]MCD5348430.1 helix-turn-helix domain-containing protein [Agromyces sp. S2-1-8]
MDDDYWARFPEALTTADVARILRVGEKTALRRLSDGTVPGYRLSDRSWVIFRDELRSMLEAVSNWGNGTPVDVDVLADYPDELGYRELMRLLGKSKPTIYAWLDDATIPGHQVNGLWVVYRHELRAALDAKRNKPRAERPAASSD